MPNCSTTTTGSYSHGEGSASQHVSYGVSTSTTHEGPYLLNCQHPPGSRTGDNTTTQRPCHARKKYARVDEEKLYIPAMKAMLLLLGPRAQSSCRSTCSSFAVAFTELVNEEAVSVTASQVDDDGHTTTTPHNPCPATMGVVDTVPVQTQLSYPFRHGGIFNDPTHFITQPRKIQVVVVSSGAASDDAGGSALGSRSLEVRSTDITLEPPPGSDIGDDDDKNNVTTASSITPAPLTLPTSLVDNSSGFSDGVASDDYGVVKEIINDDIYGGSGGDNYMSIVSESPNCQHGSPPPTTTFQPKTPTNPSLFEFIPTTTSKWLQRASSTPAEHSDPQTEEMKKNLLKWAPASLTSPHLQSLHIVVNIEVLALLVTNTSVGYTIKQSPIPRVKYLYIHILDGLCAHLVAKSVEFIGMSKVFSIGSGLLLDAKVETVTYGKLPRLVQVEDDWMAGCTHLRHVNFAEPLPNLKVVRHGWMRGCRALTSIDLTPFPTVEHVGDHWLSQCNSLQYANFTAMPFLISVGHFWLYGTVSLRRVSFADMAYLVRIGTSWLAHCCVLEEASFGNMPALLSIGEGFGEGSSLWGPS